MTQKLGGHFEQFEDPMGNPLISFNRDGTINANGVLFPDGTSLTSHIAADEGILFFGRTVKGVIRSTIRIENATSGNVDLFTVPTGKRAVVIYNGYNSAGTNTTVSQQIKISGVYNQIGGSFVVNTNAVTSGGYTSGYIFEAGETAAFNSSQAGMNYFGTAYVFPATEPFKTVKNTALTSGDNLIYTCPAGKTANCIFGSNQITGSSNSAINPAVFNSSGGPLNYYYNIVSSGGTPSLANQAVPVTAVASLATGVFGAFGFWALTAGDSIYINASGVSAGWGWVTVQEI